MKHFQIGDKVKVAQNQEKPWTYDYIDETYYIVGIDLPKKNGSYGYGYVDEYDVEYTLAEEYPNNKYGYTDEFKHGDLILAT